MSEQSYTHVSLRELRRVMATRLGFDPEGDSNDMVAKQLTEYIRTASLQANEQCQWIHAHRTVGFTVSQGMESVPFPPGCGPGSILELSIWIDDETRAGLSQPVVYGWPSNVFIPLDRRYMGNRFDSDPLWAEGGDAAARVQGVPRVYDVRDRILLRPVPDKQYQMKLLFTYTPELRCDDDITTMDGELIVRYALAEYYSYAEEFGNSDRAMAKAESRLRFLRGQQNTGEIQRFQHDIGLRLSPDEESMMFRPADLPRFDFAALGQTWDAAGIVTNPSPSV